MIFDCGLVLLLAIGPPLIGAPAYDGVGRPPAAAPVRNDRVARGPLPLNLGSLADLMSVAGARARVFSSEHFVVVSTADATRAQPLLSQFESLYAAVEGFAAAIRVGRVRPEQKLEIVLFGAYAEFDAFRSRCEEERRDVVGFYDERTDRTALLDVRDLPALKLLRQRVEELALDEHSRHAVLRGLETRSDSLFTQVARHEAAHHILRAMRVIPPRGETPIWLNEGLAQAFEPTEADRLPLRQIVHTARLLELRRTFGEAGERIPALSEVLFSDEWWRDEGADAYPLAWAIHQYLLVKHSFSYAEWFRGLSEEHNRDSRARFESHFGKVNSKWTADFRDFVNALPLDARSLPHAPDVPVPAHSPACSAPP